MPFSSPDAASARNPIDPAHASVRPHGLAPGSVEALPGPPSGKVAPEDKTVGGATFPRLVSKIVLFPKQELAKHDVNFADASGNAHIAHGAWFIFTAGRSAPASATPSTLTASTWKVAYAILRNPELGSETVRELAAQAGVWPGATTKAIQALDERGWVSNHGHQRLLVRPETLWRAWEGGWVDRLATKLFITRATTPSHRTLLDWSDLASSVEHVLIGGGVAAQRRGTGIVAETATVHVREWNAATMAQLRLAPDDTGSITVRQRFGALDEDPDHPGLAHPMLVRADLLTVLDERLDGTRQQLAEHILRDLPDAP